MRYMLLASDNGYTKEEFIKKINDKDRFTIYTYPHTNTSLSSDSWNNKNLTTTQKQEILDISFLEPFLYSSTQGQTGKVLTDREAFDRYVEVFGRVPSKRALEKFKSKYNKPAPLEINKLAKHLITLLAFYMCESYYGSAHTINNNSKAFILSIANTIGNHLYFGGVKYEYFSFLFDNYELLFIGYNKKNRYTNDDIVSQSITPIKNNYTTYIKKSGNFIDLQATKTALKSINGVIDVVKVLTHTSNLNDLTEFIKVSKDGSEPISLY